MRISKYIILCDQYRLSLPLGTLIWIKRVLLSACPQVRILRWGDGRLSTLCLAAGPRTLPQPVLCSVRSSASSFNFHCLLLPLRSSNSCLLLFHRLLVPSILRSVKCFRRYFLCEMWPVHIVTNDICQIKYKSYISQTSPALTTRSNSFWE
jgi:hypothetical protein